MFRVRMMALLVMALGLFVVPGMVQDVAAQNDGKAVTLLDELSSWRMTHILRAPAIDSGRGIVKHESGIQWLDEYTPEAPPTGWQQIDFDDSAWLRTTALGSCRTPFLARQCIRGKFRVADPAKARGLTVSVEYHGGAVVYLNGKEIARRHVPSGPINNDTLAEGYPLEAFVDKDGHLLAEPGTYINRGRAKKPDADQQKRMDARVRRLEGVNLPPALLKRGVNVLAIELIRAPYDKVLLETQEQAGTKNRRNKYDWGTCQFFSAELRAASADGLVVEPHRAKGFRLFNSDIMEPVSTFSYGDPAEELQPIRIVGARGGVFSGRVIAGSTEAIQGLSATVTALRSSSGGATISESAIQVRYGYQWGFEVGFSGGGGLIVPPQPHSLHLMGGMIETPPAEVPVVSARNTPVEPGAAMPIYVTVRVPENAAAGIYKGELKISAAGVAPVVAEVELEVIDCTLPGSQNQRTWIELIQAPEVLSLEYDVELWSDRHFELIAKSFRLLRDSGTRILYVPAIAHTNLGSRESMIRWIRKADGSYDWDFSVMDRYLELAAKELGEPKAIVLQVWEIYLSPKERTGRRFAGGFDERQEETGGQALVTFVDPESGKTENKPVVGPGEEGSLPVWSELVKQVRLRLKARGLEDRLMFGMFTDVAPSREQITFFHKIAPDVAWVQHGHGRWQKKVYDIAEVGYQATVWGGFRFGDGLKQTNQKGDPVVESLHGWKGPKLDVVFERNQGLDNYSTSRWRFFPETGITSELRGIGRVGGDYWRVLKNPSGKRTGLAHERYNAGTWATNVINLNLATSTLAPGPDGPIMTTRLMAMVEGVQEAEARIIIEAALTDPAMKRKLGPALAGQCQKLLDTRLRDMWRTLSNLHLGGGSFFGAGAWRWAANTGGHRWYLGQDWQRWSRELFELAGKVQKATR